MMLQEPKEKATIHPSSPSLLKEEEDSGSKEIRKKDSFH